EKRLVEARGLESPEADLHSNAMPPQKGESLALHHGVRILSRSDDASDACFDDSSHARTGSTLVTTRLKGAVERRTARLLSRHIERAYLRVRFAGALVISLADHEASSRDDNRPHHRIRTRPAAAARCEKQRAIHEVFVYHFSSNSPSTYSSAEKGTRSSI